MPNFQLSDDDARDISAFLIGQSTPYSAGEARKLPPVPAQDDAAALQQGSKYIAKPSAPPAMRCKTQQG